MYILSRFLRVFFYLSSLYLSPTKRRKYSGLLGKKKIFILDVFLVPICQITYIHQCKYSMFTLIDEALF